VEVSKQFVVVARTSQAELSIFETVWDAPLVVGTG
jgi:hypothetical protein